MRKWISLLLALALLLNGIPVLKAHAEDQQERAVAALQYQDSDLQDAICRADHIMYWNMIDQIADNATLTKLLEMASDKIEESATEEKCATFLATILTMQQYNIAQQLEQQSDYDDLKSTGDYVMDALKIANNMLEVAEVLPIITPALETAMNGAELVQDNLNQVKYYNMVISDYCDSAIVLQAIIKYCRDPELKKAASAIASGREELLEKQLTYLENSLNNIAEFEWKFFADQLFFPLMKEMDAYQDNGIFQWFVDAGEFCFDDLKSMQEAAFSIVMLAGDIGFGTTNTFKRYQEMRILSDVSSALSKAITQLQIPAQGTKEQIVAVARQKCSLYKLLLTAHTRGEYLIYQLLTQDSGILSLLRRTYEQSHDGVPFTEATYTSQIEAIEVYYNNILRIEQMLRSQEHDSLEGGYDIGTLVSDAYSDFIPNNLYNTEGYFYIPKVNADLPEIEKTNAQIYNDYYSFMQTQVYGPIEAGSNTQIERISYIWEVKDSYLSILMLIIWGNEPICGVYTVSLETGALVDASELLTAYGITEEGFNELVEQSSQKIGENLLDPVPYVNPGNKDLCAVGVSEEWGYSKLVNLTGTIDPVYPWDIPVSEEMTKASEQENTQPDSVPEATDGDAVLTWEVIPQHFIFTSGAGAWQTSLDLQSDGSFSGAYSDSNMGESSDAYPHGTVYYCNFNGQFTQPQPVTEYCYSVELTEFSAEDSENAEYIDNGIRYVRSEPYGFNDSQCFYLYLPGTPVADLPEDCLYWLNLLQQVESEIPSGMYVIYNQVETAVFVGSLE